MAMDLNLIDWIASTEVADARDASTIASVGESLLRKEPMLPAIVNVECHIRLASLRLRSGEPDLAHRHPAHASRLAFDMPAEAQLHALPRALALLRATSTLIGDELPGTVQTIEQGSAAVGDAMTTTIEVADNGLVELAVVEAIAHAAMALEGKDRDDAEIAVGERAARLALKLETAGEMQLAARAGEIGFSETRI